MIYCFLQVFLLFRLCNLRKLNNEFQALQFRHSGAQYLRDKRKPLTVRETSWDSKYFFEWEFCKIMRGRNVRLQFHDHFFLHFYPRRIYKACISRIASSWIRDASSATMPRVINRRYDRIFENYRWSDLMVIDVTLRKYYHLCSHDTLKIFKSERTMQRAARACKFMARGRTCACRYEYKRA